MLCGYAGLPFCKSERLLVRVSLTLALANGESIVQDSNRWDILRTGIASAQHSIELAVVSDQFQCDPRTLSFLSLVRAFC